MSRPIESRVRNGYKGVEKLSGISDLVHSSFANVLERQIEQGRSPVWYVINQAGVASGGHLRITIGQDSIGRMIEVKPCQEGVAVSVSAYVGMPKNGYDQEPDLQTEIGVLVDPLESRGAFEELLERAYTTVSSWQ